MYGSMQMQLDNALENALLIVSCLTTNWGPYYTPDRGITALYQQNVVLCTRKWAVYNTGQHTKCRRKPGLSCVVEQSHFQSSRTGYYTPIISASR